MLECNKKCIYVEKRRNWFCQERVFAVSMAQFSGAKNDHYWTSYLEVGLPSNVSIGKYIDRLQKVMPENGKKIEAMIF